MVFARFGRPAALLLAAVSTVTLAGCTPRGDDQATGEPTSATTTSAATSPVASPSDTEATGTTPAPSRTVATKEREGDGVHLRLEIYALDRSGETAVLDFGVRNLGSEEIVLDKALSKDGKTDDVSGVYLYESAARLQHWPATVDGECVCSTDLGVVAPGQVQFLSATYSPPEDGVDTVDVHVPTVGKLADVPVGG